MKKVAPLMALEELWRVDQHFSPATYMSMAFPIILCPVVIECSLGWVENRN